MGRFICEGFGKKFKVEADSYSGARYKAARRLKKETGTEKAASFLAQFFIVHSTSLKSMGRHRRERFV